MCKHPKTLHLRCGHTGYGISTICHYRYLIGHKATSDITRVDELCTACVKEGKKRASKQQAGNEEESADERIKDER
jgi:hypothetical protein